MQSDGFNSALSPVVYGDIALSINTHYITFIKSGFQYIANVFSGKFAFWGSVLILLC